MSRIKPIPIPPEETSFQKGISMSEQLRKEKAEVERTAIARRAPNSEFEPKRRGPQKGQGGRPRRKMGHAYTPEEVQKVIDSMQQQGGSK